MLLEWWNWQTRYLEGVVGIRPCGFESRLQHESRKRSGIFVMERGAEVTPV